MTLRLRLMVLCDAPGCYARTFPDRAFIEGWVLGPVSDRDPHAGPDFCYEHRPAGGGSDA
jgi:hypothetical protein